MTDEKNGTGTKPSGHAEGQSANAARTGGARDEASEALEERRLEELRRFQVRTMPPELRAELLLTEAPLVAPDELQDTRPPNQSALAAPAQIAAVDPRKATTLILRRTKIRRSWPALVLGVVVGALLVSLLGIVLARGGWLAGMAPARTELPPSMTEATELKANTSQDATALQALSSRAPIDESSARLAPAAAPTPCTAAPAPSAPTVEPRPKPAVPRSARPMRSPPPKTGTIDLKKPLY